MLRSDDGVIEECNNEIYTVKACTPSTSATFCRLTSHARENFMQAARHTVKYNPAAWIPARRDVVANLS
ncbi:GM16113 [Drosophila sechellia]|uniref:GM16113 n=1 Tax=Drosophila sechellia TaxID=7238 RepID=B4IIJ7_DROSE|nr:GM16113 [Drosophila sechellia]